MLLMNAANLSCSACSTQSFDYDTPDNEFMSGILRDKGEVRKKDNSKVVVGSFETY